MKFNLVIILMLSSVFTIPAVITKFESILFDRVAGRLKAINSKIYPLSTAFFCASKCQLMNYQKINSTCFGFNYNGSVCEIITSFNDSQRVTGEAGYNYYTERCPPKKECQNNGTIIYTHSSFCGEPDRCACVGPKAAPGGKYYGGQWCEKICNYTVDKAKDLPGGDLYIQFNVTNVEICLQTCAENSTCVGIQYNTNVRCIYKPISKYTPGHEPFISACSDCAYYSEQCVP